MYNFGVHIVHATIADLITVFLLKNVVKFVVRRKMFVKLGRENYVLCWFNTLTEKRVKPNDAAYISAWLLWCFLHRHEIRLFVDVGI